MLESAGVAYVDRAHEATPFIDPVQTINNAVIPDEARDLGDIRLR